MQYLVIYSNGKSQCFYNETVANTYKTINNGFVINIFNDESIDSMDEQYYTESIVN